MITRNTPKYLETMTFQKYLDKYNINIDTNKRANSEFCDYMSINPTCSVYEHKGHHILILLSCSYTDSLGNDNRKTHIFFIVRNIKRRIFYDSIAPCIIIEGCYCLEHRYRKLQKEMTPALDVAVRCALNKIIIQDNYVQIRQVRK